MNKSPYDYVCIVCLYGFVSCVYMLCVCVVCMSAACVYTPCLCYIRVLANVEF